MLTSRDINAAGARTLPKAVLQHKSLPPFTQKRWLWWAVHCSPNGARCRSMWLDVTDIKSVTSNFIVLGTIGYEL